MKQLNLSGARLVAAILATTALAFAHILPATAQDNAAQRRAVEEKQYQSPSETLRAARVLFVRSRSGFFNREAFEKEILQRSEKQKLELAITRDELQADLVVEVYRKRFSTRFVFSVIEPRTKQVLASDKSSSLGGEIESDLANLLIKKIKAARAV